ncbi:ABC transporter permease (plasmid) [Brucella anthropi]|uniref:ABC transporter permease n=1 Tax=Brucella anthropi TaxID=529 RepID=UPI00188C31BE|nr:ABC transporter permease [Brucella anthropi]QPA29861.1 ABC transporter permease [Brucella anthropi]
MTRGSDGSWSRNDGDDLYVRILGRTLFIAAQVALLTTLIGYPIAYLIANSSPTVRWLVLSAVVLSFWTSILVRTTAWVVLLQTRGLVNELLLWLNFIDEPLQLIFNRLGAVLAMTHVMLPFAILPIYNVMRTIPPDQRLASRSLGAGPIETFLRAYLPQTKRGILIGAGTVYILALGFYITPALTGGPSDQMLSYYISDFVQRGLNWGMASTLSILLLICLLVMLGIGVLLLRVLGPGAESPR